MAFLYIVLSSRVGLWACIRREMALHPPKPESPPSLGWSVMSDASHLFIFIHRTRSVKSLSSLPPYSSIPRCSDRHHLALPNRTINTTILSPLAPLQSDHILQPPTPSISLALFGCLLFRIPPPSPSVMILLSPAPEASLPCCGPGPAIFWKGGEAQEAADSRRTG